jgi:hypothetical protein
MAAALVPIVAEVGAVGLSTYKLVQTESGGSVGIDFPKGKDGKVLPPQPLTPVSRAAVWPGDAGTVRFAEKLGQAGLKVSPPATVLAKLADLHPTVDLNQVTEAERDEAFDAVCKRLGVELVFAARSLGTSSDSNTFSLSRATVTSKADLLAYSCARKQIVWTDQIVLVVELGASHTPTSSEIAQVGGDAWAERVLIAIQRSNS